MIRCVRTIIWALLFLLIVVNKEISAKSSKLKTRFTDLHCESLDVSFSNFPMCRLSHLRKGIALHLHCKLFKVPVNNVSVNFQLFKREKNYVPFLYNQSADFCKLMAQRKTFPMMNIILDILSKNTNINHTCPYAHDIIIKDLVLSNDHLNMLPLPVGEFMFRVHVGAYNEWKAIVRFLFKNN